MARRKPVLLLTGVIAFTVLLAVIGMELTIGLSLRRGLPGLSVKEIFLMGDSHKLYLSIDLDPSKTPLKTIRVPLKQITFDLNAASSSDVVLSSTDAYIWGDRWPWVENVTITLKTSLQQEGFNKLFAPEKLKQLQDDLKKGKAIGVTHFGQLTVGGRIMEYY